MSKFTINFEETKYKRESDNKLMLVRKVKINSMGKEVVYEDEIDVHELNSENTPLNAFELWAIDYFYDNGRTTEWYKALRNDYEPEVATSTE